MGIDLGNLICIEQVEYLPVVSPLDNKKESAACFSERVRICVDKNPFFFRHDFGFASLFFSLFMPLFYRLLMEVDTYKYMQTCHAMATSLNVVQTSHSYGDLMLLMKATQSKSKLVYIFVYSDALPIFCNKL